jgi:hypothetical protein
MRPTLAAACLLLALTPASCAPGGDAPPAEADPEAAADDAPAELVPSAPEEPASATLPADRAREDPLPEEIYYSLDDFEWYRHAQPIVHGGRAYEAQDTVLVRSTLELDSLARFGGVLYWARPGDAEPDTVFVPVFEGYWLPFVAGGGGA